MRIIKIIFGNVLMTFAYAFLAVPNRIINGGVTSFSMVLSGMLGWDTAVVADGIMLLFMGLSYVFLGGHYVKGTLIGGISYMVSFSIFHSLHICLIPIRLPAALAAALLVGWGYYLCISQQATAVSFDTIALILKKKNPRVNVAVVMGGINVCVLLLGASSYGAASVALGILFTGIQTLTLDMLLKNRQAAKNT